MRARQEMPRRGQYVLVAMGWPADLGEGRHGNHQGAHAFEFEEYLHGPIHTDQNLRHLRPLGEEEQRARIEKLYEIHRVFLQMPGGPHSRDVPAAMSGSPKRSPLGVPQLLSACVPGLMGLEEGNEIYDAYTSRCLPR